MSYKEFKNPEQIKHLDNVMNELQAVKSLYQCTRNKNRRKEVENKFFELYELIDKEKWENLNDNVKKDFPTIMEKYKIKYAK